MLQNFLICLNAVIPLSIYLIIGMIIKKVGIINDKEVKRFNHLVFVVFYPPLMFANLYSADIGDAFNPKLIGFAVAFVFAVIAVSIPLTGLVEKTPESRGAMIQGIYRSNFVLMGLPVAMNIFGRGNVSPTAVLVMIIVPIYNVMAVIILEYFRGGHPDAKGMAKKIITNPIIIGATAAILCMALHITLPTAIEGVVNNMSDATTPIALMILGASFNVQSVRRGKKDLAIVVLARLVLVPAIGLSIAVAMGFRGVEFVSLLAMMAAPTAVSSFTMAESMGSDGELAGNVVIFTTPISVITLFLWLFFFKTMGMF